MSESQQPRDVRTAVLRGMKGRCPKCGEGRIFPAYLKVADECPVCGEELHHHRADDAPAYIVISIVGHIVVGLMLVVELTYRPELWIHFLMWIPLTIVLCLLLLPPVKGALVGLQWGLRMHGFHDPETRNAPPPFPEPR